MNWNILVLFANDDGNEQEPGQQREKEPEQDAEKAQYKQPKKAQNVLEQEPEQEPTMLYDDSDDT